MENEGRLFSNCYLQPVDNNIIRRDKPEEQSKLNDDDFFFNFRHSKENDTVTHDSELVVIFQPQVQSLQVMKKFN